MLESINDGIKELMIIEPFYGLLALGVEKHFSDLVPTAAVSLNKDRLSFNLHFNKDLWDRLEDPHKVGILHHELLHLAEFHLFDMDWYDDKDLANIAMDMRINQYIPPANLPDWVIKLDSFPPAVYAPFLSSREYYELLKKDLPNNEQLQSLLAAIKADQANVCWHKTWEMPDNIDDNMKDLFQKQLEYQIMDIYENYANKNMGFFPGSIQERLKKLLEKVKPVTDWTKVVRRFGCNSIKTNTRSVRSKINARYPDNPAIKVYEQKGLLVIIDTSGSMPTQLLVKLFAQIDYISKLGIDVYVAQCDTRLHDVSLYDRNFNKDIKIYGRGDTDFTDAISLLNTDKRFNGAVFFTDGYGNYAVNPKKPLLWLVTPGGSTASLKHGHTLVIEEI